MSIYMVDPSTLALARDPLLRGEQLPVSLGTHWSEVFREGTAADAGNMLFVDVLKIEPSVIPEKHGPFKPLKADKLSTRRCESVSNKLMLSLEKPMTSVVVYRTIIARSSSEASCEHDRNCSGRKDKFSKPNPHTCNDAYHHGLTSTKSFSRLFE